MMVQSPQSKAPGAQSAPIILPSIGHPGESGFIHRPGDLLSARRFAVRKRLWI